MIGPAIERTVPARPKDLMDHDPDTVAHAKFHMRLSPDGLVHLVWGEGVVMVVGDAVAAIEAMTRLTGGLQHPLLVDVHALGPTDRAARMEFTRRGDLVSAIAIVVGTPLSRLMGNFFLSVSKPTAPTRLFDDEASALAWLKDSAGWR